MTAEQTARLSCGQVFDALARSGLSGTEQASIEDQFNAGVAAGITMAASGESPFTMEMFAHGSWRALGIIAGYEAFLEETGQFLGRAA